MARASTGVEPADHAVGPNASAEDQSLAAAVAVVHEVRGTVTSEEGEALPGVNIVVKGASIGTAANADGGYVIEAPTANDTLMFTFVGFIPQEVPIDGRSVIDVVMESDTEMLSEVMVVGYGTLGRESVTAAIEKVSGEELTDIPVPSVAEALQGRAAGITVAADDPGREPQVRIRGLTTPNNNAPLYVVDGVPVDGLLGVNPSNIESVEVLKDASAAAIYGSRASGGVILVTTKRGGQRAGGEGIQVTFNSFVGVQEPWKTLDLLNTPEYVAYATAISEAAGASPPARLSDLPADAPSIDYQDEIFRTAPMMNYDLGFMGGGETAQYRVGIGYLDQEGAVINSGFRRYSGSVNTDFEFGRFRFGESLNLAFMQRDNIRVTGGRSLLEHVTKYAPYLPVRDADGTFNGPDQVDDNDAENPVRVQEIGDNQREESRVIGNVYGEVSVAEGLTLRQVLGIESYFSNDFIFTPSYDDGDFHSIPYATVDEQRTSFFAPLSTTTLNYQNTFGPHTVNALGGVEYQTFFTRLAGASGRNTLSDDIDVLDAIEEDVAIGNETRDVLLSYFARANYNFDDRYLLQASIRRDGYSRFGPDSRIGYFPSVSVGWNVAEEAFMEDSFFDILKLRASYGEVGNNNAIGPYEYQPTVSTNYFYIFNNELVPSATIPGLSNAALQWESTQMINVGGDVAFLDNALSLTAEYYRNTTADVLLTVPLPGSFGFDFDPRFNTGEVETSGFEFSLGYLGGGEQFNWDISANLATATNEVTSLGMSNPLSGGEYGGASTFITRVEEGEPLYFFYGYQVDRLYQESDFSDGTLNSNLPAQSNVAPGDIKFMDLNNDGVVNDEDRTNIGEPMPDFTFGLDAKVNWRNFDLGFFLQGATGHQIYRAYAYWTEGMLRVFNATTDVLDRWTPQNTDTDVPRGVVGDPANNTRASDRWVEDGDYVRLKLLTIGYRVPIQFAGVNRLRVYVQGRNLLTFTGYDGYDPEIGVWSDDPSNFTSDYGVDYGQYPQPRSYVFGLQVGF